MKTQQSLNVHFFGRILFAFLISLTAFSCSKDKNEPVPDAVNELIYNDQTYPLNYGAIDAYGFDGSHTNYEFHLFNIISETNPVVPTYIYFNLYAPDEAGFKAGTFQYIGNDESEVEGKYYFDEGYLAQNINLESGVIEEIAHIQAGTVKVSGSGMDYTLEFDVVVDNGKSVKGSYGGTFQPLNEPDAATHSKPGAILNKLSACTTKKHGD